MNKDVAHIIGKYSLPTLWEVQIKLNRVGDVERYFFYGDDSDKIYKWLVKHRSDLIYTLMEDLYRLGVHFDNGYLVRNNSETDFSKIKKQYYENTEEMIRWLVSSEAMLSLKQIKPHNLY